MTLAGIKSPEQEAREDEDAAMRQRVEREEAARVKLEATAAAKQQKDAETRAKQEGYVLRIDPASGISEPVKAPNGGALRKTQNSQVFVDENEGKAWAQTPQGEWKDAYEVHGRTSVNSKGRRVQTLRGMAERDLGEDPEWTKTQTAKASIDKAAGLVGQAKEAQQHADRMRAIQKADIDKDVTLTASKLRRAQKNEEPQDVIEALEAENLAALDRQTKFYQDEPAKATVSAEQSRTLDEMGRGLTTLRADVKANRAPSYAGPTVGPSTAGPSAESSEPVTIPDLQESISTRAQELKTKQNALNLDAQLVNRKAEEATSKWNDLREQNLMMTQPGQQSGETVVVHGQDSEGNPTNEVWVKDLWLKARAAFQDMQKAQKDTESQWADIERRQTELATEIDGINHDKEKVKTAARADRDAKMAELTKRKSVMLGEVGPKVTALDREFDAALDAIEKESAGLSPEVQPEFESQLAAMVSEYETKREGLLKEGQARYQKAWDEAAAIVSEPIDKQDDEDLVDWIRRAWTTKVTWIADRAHLTPQEAGTVAKDYIDATSWKGDFDTAKTRILSDGRLVIRPTLWADPDAYKQAVEESAASAEEKETAMAIMPELRLKAATAIVESVSAIPQFKEWLDAQPGNTEQKATAFVREQKKGGWVDQLINRINSGGAAIGQQASAILAAITGNVTGDAENGVGGAMHDLMGFFSQRAAAYDSAAELADTGLLANSLTKIAGAGTSLLPAMVGGAAAPARPLLGSAIAAGLQSAGGTYADAFSQMTKEGKGANLAMRDAIKPALASGFLTLALTYGGGARGVERLFASPVGRETAKNLLRRKFTEIGVDIGEEALEEGLDQLGQGMIAASTYNPDKSIGEIFNEAFEAAWIGGALGGVVSGAQGAVEVGGELLANHQQRQALSASEDELASYIPPEGTKPEVAAATTLQAATLRDIAQGAELDSLDEQQLDSVGLKRDDKGKVVQGTSKGVPAVKLEAGKPIITQGAIDQLEQNFPATHALIGMSEQEARAKAKQPKPKNGGDPTQSQTTGVPGDASPGTVSDPGRGAGSAVTGPDTSAVPGEAAAGRVPGDTGAVAEGSPAQDGGTEEAGDTTEDPGAIAVPEGEQPSKFINAWADQLARVAEASGKSKAATSVRARARLLGLTLDKWAPKTGGIKFRTFDEAGAASGLQVNPNTWEVQIDPQRLMRRIAKFKGAKEMQSFLDAAMDEDFRHQIAIGLEQTSPTFKANLDAFWKALPAKLKKRSAEIYHYEHGKEFGDEFLAKHEFLRQYWQHADLRTMTEETDTKGVLESLLELMKEFVRDLQRIQKGKAHPQVKASADALLQEARAAVAQIEAKLAKETKTSQSTQSAKPQSISTDQIAETVGGFGKGIAAGLYQSVYDHLKSGKKYDKSFPLSEQVAQHLYDRGLIDSVETLRKVMLEAIRVADEARAAGTPIGTALNDWLSNAYPVQKSESKGGKTAPTGTKPADSATKAPKSESAPEAPPVTNLDPVALAKEAARTWLKANRNWTAELQEGELHANKAFDAVAEDGQHIPAHGMAKANPVSAIDALASIFRDGIQNNNRAGGLHFAPVAKPRGQAGLATTAGGVAVRDGAFILVGRPGMKTFTDAANITAVLVNPALGPEMVEAVRAMVPSGVLVVDYNGVSQAVEAAKARPMEQTEAAPLDPVKAAAVAKMDARVAELRQQGTEGANKAADILQEKADRLRGATSPEPVKTQEKAPERAPATPAAKARAPRPAPLHKTAGWKLHLTTAKAEEVSKLLKQAGYEHKVDKNGGQSGKDVTVYVGSREDAQKAAEAIEKAAGHLLGTPTGDVMTDDVAMTPKVMARFDARGDEEFNQYGSQGVPYFNDDVAQRLWGDKKPTAEEARARAHEALKAKYGEFYTGKESTPDNGVKPVFFTPTPAPAAKPPAFVNPPRPAHDLAREQEEQRAQWQKDYTRFKNRLTRAERLGPQAVLDEVKAYREHYAKPESGPEPDQSSRWDRAENDARLKLGQNQAVTPVTKPLVSPEQEEQARFAADVMKSASNVPASGRPWGGDKVFISDVYAEWAKTHPGVSLDQFKAMLNANRGRVSLSRLDLVESLTPEETAKNKQSAVFLFGEEANLIRAPYQPAEVPRGTVEQASTPAPAISERRKAAIEVLKKAMAPKEGLGAPPGPRRDPAFIAAATEMANVLYDEGVQTPEAFAAAMVEGFGDLADARLLGAVWGLSPAYDPDEAIKWSEVLATAKTPEKLEAGEAKTELKVDVSNADEATEWVADNVHNLLEEGKEVPVKELRAAVGEHLTPKEFDEAVELGVTQLAHAIAGDMSMQPGGVPLTMVQKFKKLVDLYNRQPVLRQKTSTSKINQAYSTPAPMAYAAAVINNTVGGDVVYEPTAGNGMLLLTTTTKQDVHANEMDPGRAKRLEMQDFKPTTADATVWGPKTAPDRIIANPPFGQVLDDDQKNKVWTTPFGETTSIDHAIMARALESMNPTGRATFIIGGPPPLARSAKGRAEFYAKGKSGDFMRWLYDNYKVVDHFTVSGDLYEKQGAGWPVDIITIQGRGKSRVSLPSLKAPRMIGSWDALQKELTKTDEQRIADTSIQQADLDNRVDQAVSGLAGLSGSLQGSAGDGQQSGSVSQSAEPALNPVRAENSSTEEAGGRPEPDAQPDSGPDRQGSPGPAPGRGSSESGVGSDQAPSGPGPVRVEQVNVDTAGDESGNVFQIDYAPASKTNPGGFLAPINMARPMYEALEKLVKQVGPLVPYVTQKLGYPKGTDISKYFFGDQIDALAQAIYNAENNGALVVGDQTGTGKGRIAAGLMRYAVNRGLIPVFVTKKPDLYAAMLEDLSDIGTTNVKPAVTNNDLPEQLRKMKLPSGKEVFEQIGQTGELPAGANAIFTTYSQISSDTDPKTDKKARAQALRDKQAPPHWWRTEALMRIAPNAIFILDESHLAAGESTIGFRFADMLRKAKSAYYSSATFAKRAENMAIYFRTRLGQMGDGFNDLIAVMQAGGVPAMQVGSTMLAQDGQYMRRERSFDGIRFMPFISTETEERDRGLADQYTEGLRVIVQVQERMARAAEQINAVVAASGKRWGIPAANQMKLDSANFSAKLHNLIRQYLLAIKSRGVAQAAIEAIKDGFVDVNGNKTSRKVVVAVENTMESIIQDVASKGLPLTFSGALRSYLEQMRTFNTGTRANPQTFTVSDTPDPDFAKLDNQAMKALLIRREEGPDGEPVIALNEPAVKELTRRFMSDTFKEAREVVDGLNLADMPLSPIDAMRQEVERAGIKTAEITARRDGINENGEVYARPESERKGGLTAMDQFNNGDVDFIVLNNSGSTGISLHASQKFKDQRPRLMIVAQASLDINEFMQMLGRVHRSGQVALPDFLLFQTALPAEKRPAAIQGKKMAMLNANTTSNADSEVSAGSANAVDLFNEYGDEVVWEYLGNHMRLAGLINQSWSKLLSKDGLLNPLSDFLSGEHGGPGYLSRSVTGHLAILPVEEQEAFWEQVEGNYRAKIEYLDSIGQNKLKAENLDIRAKTLSREVIFSGPENGSVFSEPAYLETVEAQLGREPLTAEDAQAGAIEARNRADSLRKDYMRRADEQIATNEADKAKKSVSDWGKRRDEWLTKQRSARDRIANAVANVGLFGTYKREDGTEGFGYISDVRLDEDNLLAPSAQRFVVMLSDSKYSITIPGSQIEEFFKPRAFGGKEGWERTRDASAVRNIVTGNLLAGLKHYGTTGRIVNYTTDEGQVQTGILMPATFTAGQKAVQSSQKTVNTGEQAVAMFTDNEIKDIVNEDGGLSLFKSGNDAFILRVPASRSAGGKYWRDPTLNKLLDRGEFAEQSGWMVGAVKASNLASVVDRLVSIDKKPLKGNPAPNLGAPAGPGATDDDSEAIASLLDELEQDAPSVEEIRALFEYGVTEEAGQRTLGNPDIANPGQTPEARALFDAVREVYEREVLRTRSNEDLDEAGRNRASRDPMGVERAVLDAYANGQPLSDLDTRAAMHVQNMLVNRAMLSGSDADMRRATLFTLAYTGLGTSVARALQARQDQTMTPQERLSAMFAEALTQPSSDMAKVDLEGAPRAAERARTLQRIERELAAAREALEKAKTEADKKAAQTRVDAIQKQKTDENRKKTKEQVALEVAKEQRDKISKALAKEGLTIDDLLAGRVQHRLQFGKLVVQAMGQNNPRKEKAIDLIVHGWPTSEISRVLRMSQSVVQGIREELRANPRPVLDAIKDLLRRGVDVKGLSRALGAPAGPQQSTHSEADLEAMARKIMESLIPTEKQADRSKWKKVRRANPALKPDIEAALARTVDRLENPPERRQEGRNARISQLVRRHRSGEGVSDFVEQAVGMGAAQATAQRAHDLIEQERAARRRPVQEVDLDWEYVPIDFNDRSKTYRVARVMSEAVAGAFDMVTEFWINSILSGPQTHVVNILGNAANAAWDMTVQRWMEAVMNLFVRGADSAQLGELKHLYAGVFPGVARGLRLASQAWSREQDLFEAHYLNDSQMLDDLDKYGYSGKIPGITGRTVRIPGRALRFMDSFFKGVIGTMEVGAQAYRLGRAQGFSGDQLAAFIRAEADTPGSASWRLAVEKARELTFQEDSFLAEKATEILHGSAEHRAARRAEALKAAREGDMVKARRIIKTLKWSSRLQKLLRFPFPFIKTPINIVRQGLRKSPLGSVGLAYHIAQGLYAGAKSESGFKEGFFNKVPAALLTKELAEQTLAWAATLALFSMVEGDDDDDDKRILIVGGRPYNPTEGTGDADKARREYGGTYMVVIRDADGRIIRRYPYGRIEPFATAFGGIADAIALSKRYIRNAGGPGIPAQDRAQLMAAAAKVAGGTVSHLLGQMEDKTFLRGISEWTKAAADMRSGDYANAVSKPIENILSGFVPNIIKQPMRNLDDFQRNYKQTEQIKLGPFQFSKYSFWPSSKYANPLVDIFGRDVARNESKLARVLYPLADQIHQPEELTDDALSDWNRRHPENIKGDRENEASRYFPRRNDDYKVKKPDGSEREMTLPEKREFDQRAGIKFKELQDTKGAPGKKPLKPIDTKNVVPQTMVRLRENLAQARKEARATIKRNAPEWAQKLPIPRQ